MVEKNDTIKNYNKKRRMHNILPNKGDTKNGLQQTGIRNARTKQR